MNKYDVTHRTVLWLVHFWTCPFHIFPFTVGHNTPCQFPRVSMIYDLRLSHFRCNRLSQWELAWQEFTESPSVHLFHSCYGRCTVSYCTLLVHSASRKLVPYCALLRHLRRNLINSIYHSVTYILVLSHWMVLLVRTKSILERGELTAGVRYGRNSPTCFH